MQTLNAGGRRVGAGFKRDSDTLNFTGINNTTVVNQGPIISSGGIGAI